VRVALLGPIRAAGDDGTPIDIGGVRLRMLLARLALDAGRAVSAEALVGGLWGDEAPVDAANALQSLVSRLRKALRAAGGTIDSASGGYRIEADVDAHRFEVLVTRGRRELAAGCYPEAAGSLGDALVLWHGDALADVLDAPFAQVAANRWHELRVGALEDRFDAEVRLGRHLEVLADLEAASVEHPLRERLAGLRMRALYAAGRQSEALAVYEEIRGTLAEELGVDPSAELREAHLAVVRGEVAKVAPAVDRLPVRLTSFIGREDELKLLGELLSGSRLVTLVGPGGAGKTRLATEVAARHPVHESGRVWFVPLAGVRDPGDLAGAVLASLELWEMRRVEDPRTFRPPPDTVDKVVEVLSAGESVLVLDNCEHLVEAAAQLAHDLLVRVPSLRVLATSREPLAIDGETLCPLGPLAVPGESLSVAEAIELDAVRLFVDRATAVRPGFVLDESTLDAVAEICRRLDGMPLAVELAAARLRSMSVGQIAQRLDDRFRLLTSGSRAALPRQRTLRAVVEWSWDLLDEPERVLARRLSVFPAGAEVSTIEAVCADSVLPGGDVLYVLGSLVEKSIVDAYSGENGEPRYRMLETIRVYADERLSESDEKPGMLAGLARYYVTLSERLESQTRGAGQIAVIATFDAEHDTMLSILRRALDESDVDTAHRLVGSLFWYWVIRGHNGHALTFIEEIRRFGDRLPERAAAAFNAIHTMNLSVPGPPADLMVDLPAVLDECLRTGALTHYPGLAVAIPMLAFLHQDQELAGRMVRLTLETGDPWSRAAARWVESFILTDTGDVEGAQRAYKDALSGFEKLGDRWGSAMTLGMQAESLSQAGDSAGAIVAFRQGLKLATELKATDDICQQRWRLAGEYSRSGDIESAWREIDEADKIARSGGNLQLANMVAFGRAEIAMRAGDFAQAGTLVEQIKAMASSMSVPGDIAGEWVSILEAKIAVEAGRMADAEELLKLAARSTTTRRDMPDLAQVAELLADLRWQCGAGEVAATMLGTSQVIRGAFDKGSPELRRLVTHLEAELGERRYAELYRLGSGMSKKDALAWVAGQAGIEL
jgi:predicted ATPase/DNA-binding SARP family transcriptional activator